MSPPLTPVPASLPGVVRRGTLLESARHPWVDPVVALGPAVDGLIPTSGGDREASSMVIGHDLPDWAYMPALDVVTDRAEALARIAVHVLGGAS